VAENEITGYAGDRLRKDAQLAEIGDYIEQVAGVDNAFEVPEPYDFENVEDEAAVIEDFRAEFAAEQEAAEGDNPQPVDEQNPGDVTNPDEPTEPVIN
jgi:hypothetical protein